MFDNPFNQEIFPHVQYKPLLMQLETILSHPVPSYLGEETDAHLATSSVQAVVGSEEVPPNAQSGAGCSGIT